MQYCNTIQEGILAAYSVVSNCSVGAAASGSVVVPTTVAFSGANEDAATNARDAFAADLKSGTVADVFGSDFGTITVDPDSVVAGTIANPSKIQLHRSSPLKFAQGKKLIEFHVMQVSLPMEQLL